MEVKLKIVKDVMKSYWRDTQ